MTQIDADKTHEKTYLRDLREGFRIFRPDELPTSRMTYLPAASCIESRSSRRIPNSEFRIQNSLGHYDRVFAILVITGESTSELVLEDLVKSDCVEV